MGLTARIVKSFSNHFCRRRSSLIGGLGRLMKCQMKAIVILTRTKRMCLLELLRELSRRRQSAITAHTIRTQSTALRSTPTLRSSTLAS